MLKQFLRLKIQYIKTEMEYKFNFFMMIISGIILRLLLLIVPYIIYRNIDSINGWSEDEVYLLLIFLFITEGICNIFFEGVWEIPSFIFWGELDLILLRPLSPLIQVLSRGVGLQGIGVLAFGIGSLFWTLNRLEKINAIDILIFVAFIVGGTIIRLSVYLISNSVAFWINSSGSTDIPMVIGSIGEYTKYPVDIYPKWLQFILFFAIPYAFIGYVPVQIYRTGNTLHYLILFAIVSAVFFIAAVKIFYMGIKRYESPGAA